MSTNKEKYECLLDHIVLLLLYRLVRVYYKFPKRSFLAKAQYIVCERVRTTISGMKHLFDKPTPLYLVL